MTQCEEEENLNYQQIVQGNFRTEPVVIPHTEGGVCNGQPIEHFHGNRSASTSGGQEELDSPNSYTLISGIQEQWVKKAKEAIEKKIRAFQEAKGLCIVITCESGYRIGNHIPNAHKGGRKIADCFDKRGYATCHFRNPLKSELEAIYKVLGKYILYPSSYSRLFFFFRGHGIRDHISAVDGLIDISWLISQFNAPAIADVPKLFIFDCCRVEIPGNHCVESVRPHSSDRTNVLVLYTTLDGRSSFGGEEGVEDPMTLMVRIIEMGDVDNFVELQKKLHEATQSIRERYPSLHSEMQPTMECTLHDSIHLDKERLDAMRPTGLNLVVGCVNSTVTWQPPPHARHQHLMHYNVNIRANGQTDAEWIPVERANNSKALSKVRTSQLAGYEICVEAVYEDGTTVHSSVESFPNRWMLTLCPHIFCVALLLVLISCLTTFVVYYVHPGIPSATQLIVADQIITQPMLAPSRLNTLWYEGVSIRHYRNDIDLNSEMLITVVNSEDIGVVTHSELVCDNYPSNQTVHSGNGGVTTKRTTFPLNYRFNPMYFVHGSGIAILIRIYLPRAVGTLHMATLYIFDSDVEAQMFLSTERNGKPIKTVDFVDMARKEYMYYYNVVEDAYLFFVLESKTSENYFTLFSNITSDLNSYAFTGDRPNNMTSNTFGVNGSVFSKFTFLSPPRKTFFLYSHPVEDLEPALTHLVLTYRSRSWFKISVTSMLSVLVACLTGFCIYNILQRKKCPPNEYERLV